MGCDDRLPHRVVGHCPRQGRTWRWGWTGWRGVAGAAGHGHQWDTSGAAAGDRPRDTRAADTIPPRGRRPHGPTLVDLRWVTPRTPVLHRDPTLHRDLRGAVLV